VDSKTLGIQGEALTAAYLQRQGYTLLSHRYRCREGEIDLIVRKDDLLCFVEVKTRSSLRMGLPREAVDRRKQERLRRAAMRYLCENCIEGPARFDVAEVYFDGMGKRYIQYIENAFT